MAKLVTLAAVALTLLLPSPQDSASALEREPNGWTDLLAHAGPELKGWTRGPIPPTGKLGPKTQWSLDPKTAFLVCEGNGGHDWLRWDQELSDFVYHVEWRFTPVSDGKKSYNSGVYVRNSDDARIWHQAQTGDGSGGYLFGDTLVDGRIQRINLAAQVKDKKRVKPAGEWNTYEITCKGKDISLWTNGAVTCEWHDCQVAKGYVGVEAEGYRIEFRNVKVKSL
jgi:hypothetical protein